MEGAGNSEDIALRASLSWFLTESAKRSRQNHCGSGDIMAMKVCLDVPQTIYMEGADFASDCMIPPDAKTLSKLQTHPNMRSPV